MALYLNPLDALHGDLGVVSSHDVCLMLSNSGETTELLDVLPHLKRRGVTIISLVGQKDSTLGKAAMSSLMCLLIEKFAHSILHQQPVRL